MEFTVWERLALLTLTQKLSGQPLDKIRKGLKLIDALELTKEEQALIGYKVTDSAVEWDKPNHIFVVDVDEEFVTYLMNLLVKDREKTGWSIQDKNWIAFLEKLGVPLDAS